MTSPVVSGPEGFAPYTFDLVDDWFDMSTESRTMKGWSNSRSAETEAILDGEYTLTVEFDDGYIENQSYTLSADDLTSVDSDTMGYEIFENGAIRFYWSLPQGVSGQRYSVGIRSKDGSREYARGAAQNPVDTTSQYFSVWDLHALPQGGQFTWFVRTNGSDDRDTRVQTWSNKLLTYNPFNITAIGGSTFDLTATSPDLAVTAGSNIMIEKIGSVSLRSGVVRVHCMSTTADGQDQVTSEMVIPSVAFGHVVGGLQAAGKQPQEKLEDVHKEQEGETAS